MSRGRRYDDTPKLNIKKVIATIVAIIVLIMFIVSIKKLLSSPPKTKEVSTVETYFPVYTNQKWGDAENFHITLDSGVFGVDTCVDILTKLYTENK